MSAPPRVSPALPRMAGPQPGAGQGGGEEAAGAAAADDGDVQIRQPAPCSRPKPAEGAAPALPGAAPRAERARLVRIGGCQGKAVHLRAGKVQTVEGLPA